MHRQGAQELFAGDLVKEKYPSPIDKSNTLWIVIEVEKAGAFVKLNKKNMSWKWHFNDDLVLVSSNDNKTKYRELI